MFLRMAEGYSNFNWPFLLQYVAGGYAFMAQPTIENDQPKLRRYTLITYVVQLAVKCSCLLKQLLLFTKKKQKN